MGAATVAMYRRVGRRGGPEVMSGSASGASTNHRDRLSHDPHVEPDRPGIDVAQIEVGSIVEVAEFADGDLRQSGDARLDRQSSPVPLVVLVHPDDGRPPRPN